MKHMNWSWQELMETPASVVMAVIADMEAESEASQIRAKWEKR